MCGIIGVSAQENITSVLLDGLRRLEYRGYDSAGIAVIDSEHGTLACERVCGKVKQLEAHLLNQTLQGKTGIAHTRWATHGEPSVRNAHPHHSNQKIAIVHNGIVENYISLKKGLEKQGYHFISDTDSEVIVHLIHSHMQEASLLDAVRASIAQLEGAYALGIMHVDYPETLIGVSKGSPLWVGVGDKAHYFASDYLALHQVTQSFIHLEEGDVVEFKSDKMAVYDKTGKVAQRTKTEIASSQDVATLGQFSHYMQKEIYEQPDAIKATIDYLSAEYINKTLFGIAEKTKLAQIQGVQIVACGTSYYAGCVGRCWIEHFANLPCQVDIASEFRYRNPVVQNNNLFIAISQSGETADTLAATRKARALGYTHILTICNVPESAMAKLSDSVILTQAGREIGVASTKAFTTQLVVLLTLSSLFRQYSKLNSEQESDFFQSLQKLPQQIKQVLALEDKIKSIAKKLVNKKSIIYLGRGAAFPIAQEGALKLKELSYIHAEAYPAGELKHGPLALVDKELPVIALAPPDDVFSKLKSNLQEVYARGGQLIVFADENLPIHEGMKDITVIKMPSMAECIAPIVYTIPLQLLAYHVAVFKGTDVDQPRNLAKSVTVE